MVEIRDSCFGSVRISGSVRLIMSYVQDSDRVTTCTRCDPQSTEPPLTWKKQLLLPLLCENLTSPALVIFMLILELENLIVPPGPVNNDHNNRFHCCIFDNCPSFLICHPSMTLFMPYVKNCFALTHHVHSSPNTVTGVACSNFSSHTPLDVPVVLIKTWIL